MDASSFHICLGRHRHPAGFSCPHCHGPERQLIRQQSDLLPYCCRVCDGSYTLLTNTVFEKTCQRPAPLVHLLRDIGKGEHTARFAHKLGLSRKPRQMLRQRVQTKLNPKVPADVLTDTAFEADEQYQNVEEKQPALCGAADEALRLARAQDHPSAPLKGVIGYAMRQFRRRGRVQSSYVVGKTPGCRHPKSRIARSEPRATTATREGPDGTSDLTKQGLRTDCPGVAIPQNL